MVGPARRAGRSGFFRENGRLSELSLPARAKRSTYSCVKPFNEPKPGFWISRMRMATAVVAMRVTF